MFFTFSKKTIPPVISKNKEVANKPVAIPIKIGNMFSINQYIGKCSSCDSYR
jgi:hypothetical protein